MTQPLNLPNGYYELPKGKLANVVTCLEMLSKPSVQEAALPDGFSLRRFSGADSATFRTLFKAIGEDIMWFSRAIMADEKLKVILDTPEIESYGLYHGDQAIGLLELNFTDLPNCELAFFGLTKAAIGTGLGRSLMNIAIAKAWQKPINRFWVHTCHFDHPKALPFYQRAGFKPYAVMVEIHDDPRLTGHLPYHASPHVPLIES
ncbi:MAG: GNAT family N-acetyltransferase [Alphaproteobacteria bacterium]|nr:GNAT family N-acetyltransferase [Alphaproteobacteria bacterium]